MIYIHIPFCRSFCTYCDFYSEIAGGCADEFVSALESEIRLRADEISSEINTLYIGGGTPSVLPLSVLEHIVAVLDEVGYGCPYDEFTVEVNPDDIVEKGEAYVEALMHLGVNRISMGVQSFDDGILRWMNRRHDAASARKAYAILENAGIGNISIDLIFGLSQLSDDMWADTLKKALEISSKGVLPQHISSYQLSVEPGSALARLVRNGLWKEASDETCMRQYAMLCDALRGAGYNHYEISNFALPGFEARHNSAYWRHVPYTGFGPGAHSYLPPQVQGHSVLSGACRKWNEGNLRLYVEAVESGNLALVQGRESLTQEQLVMEHIMLALRTSEGIPESFLRSHCDPHILRRSLAAGKLVPAASCVATSLSDSATSSCATTSEPCYGSFGSGLAATSLRIPESRFFISDSIIAELV
ncbi:MAG: radical SAM family heme chaperone HemW [Bacteroidales bacterium]|nr:radical SAM family heme chaperone HemW [Bacteroidales bacterium]